jgi:hypothetical protein
VDPLLGIDRETFSKGNESTRNNKGKAGTGVFRVVRAEMLKPK